MDLHDFRRNYSLGKLARKDLNADPFEQFQEWLQQIVATDFSDPTAMIVASVDAKGQPNQRYVLLKHVDNNGFVFFTDMESQKGQEIALNSKVSLLFPWHQFERQVRIKGHAEKMPVEAVEEYFYSRPKQSQQAAICSQQSQTIESRSALEQQFQEVGELSEYSLPKRWGGYVVKVDNFEFWQGGEHRLHDRFRYEKQGKDWLITRLQP